MATGGSKMNYFWVQHAQHQFGLSMECLFILLILSPCCQFQDSGVFYNQLEEQDIDTSVGSVSSTPLILQTFSDLERTNLRYGILSDESSNSDLFKIDAISGNISFAKKVDREIVCPFSVICEVNFQVAVSGANKFLVIPVEVNIQDVNDNSPRFQEPAVMDVYISEDAPENFTQTLTVAMDADGSVQFGIRSYSVEPPHDKFRVVITENFVGMAQVSLVLTGKLDRELQATHNLIVVAKDGGTPPKTGTLNVTVIVTDVNDNSPVFSMKYYTSDFSEEAGSGYNIAMVTASDRDEGDNGKVVYMLSSVLSVSSAEIQDKINVDNITGAVTLKQPLPSGQYRFLIDAQDLGTPRRYDEALLSIVVLDTINNQPTVRVNLVQNDNLSLGWVSERAEINTVVAVLRVDDPDTGRNGNVSCQSSSLHFHLQLMEPGRYKLVIARSLDREITSTHTVKVVCSDDGIPSLNASASVLLNVFDENDNAPEFTDLSYVQNIAENNLKDDTVTVVTALDMDEGQNGKIEYRLAGVVKDFTIMPDTGVIKTRKRFDREERALYRFQVLAVDHGQPPLTGTTLVTVNVIDVNDVSPIFSQDSYYFDLPENSEPGLVVGNVSVADPDLHDGGRVTLTLKPVREGEDLPFAVSIDGWISSTITFDRENRDVYQFCVVAMDNGSQKRTSSAHVTVRILDVNDNRPTFVFPEDHNFSTNVIIPTEKESTILHLDVSDADEKQNGLVIYSVVASNASHLFKIGPLSGDVITSRHLDTPDIGTYFITVNATDSGVPVMWSSRTLHLMVQLSPASEGHVIADQNVLIVVCILSFTVVVSVIVVAVVCVVSRHDRRKKQYYNHKLCPGDRRENEMGILEDNQRHTLEVHNQQNIRQHPLDGHQHGAHCYSKNVSSTERSPGYFSETSSRVNPPDKNNQRFISPSQRSQIPESVTQRNDDFHSTASAGGTTLDSGHGSDEDVSSNMEHANTPPVTMERAVPLDISFFSAHPKLNSGVLARAPGQQRQPWRPSLLKNQNTRTSNNCVKFNPGVTEIYDLTPAKLQSALNLEPACRNNSSFPAPQIHPRLVSTFKQSHESATSSRHHGRQTSLPPVHQGQKNSPSVTYFLPERQSSLSSQSSAGDASKDDSDLSTTTSGSYSLLSDTALRLTDLTGSRVRDMHI